MQIKAGLLGIDNANASLVAYLTRHGVDVQSWSVPDQPSPPQDGDSGSSSPVYVNGYEENTNGGGAKATGLGDLIASSQVLILASPVNAQSHYVAALETFNAFLRDTILFVVNGSSFAKLHGHRLRVKSVIEGCNIIGASELGVASTKENPQLPYSQLYTKPSVHQQDTSDISKDIKLLLHGLVSFRKKTLEEGATPRPSLPVSLQKDKLIESFEHLSRLEKRDTPVVTMFSGGLDSTYLLLKLQRLGFTNIHAVAVDVGIPVDEKALAKHAAHFGATFQILDGRQLLVERGVAPAIRAHAMYLGMYPISSSLSRPVIASLIADYARSLGAGLLLHTANLSQNSLPRLNNSIRRCGFSGEFGSPYVYSVVSREDKAKELAAHGLTIMSDRKLSGDENLWCREFESGPLDDPEAFDIPESAYDWTRRNKDHAPEKISLTFEGGDLVSVNGNRIALIDAIALLNREVGKFGLGRYAGLEHINTDHKVLEVREAPAASIIMDALRHLEVATLSTGTLELKQHLERTWISEAVSGHWGTPSHTMCDVAISTALKDVSGTVTYDVNHARFLPRSIVARHPRYIRDRDAWELEQSLGRCDVFIN